MIKFLSTRVSEKTPDHIRRIPLNEGTVIATMKRVRPALTFSELFPLYYCAISLPAQFPKIFYDLVTKLIGVRAMENHRSLEFLWPFSPACNGTRSFWKGSVESWEPFKIERGTTYRWRMFEVSLVFFIFTVEMVGRDWIVSLKRSDRRVQLKISVFEWQNKICSIMK